jgi:hypothetical protein
VVVGGVSGASGGAGVAGGVGVWERVGGGGPRPRFTAVLRGVLHQQLVPGKAGKGRTVEAALVAGGAAAEAV